VVDGGSPGCESGRGFFIHRSMSETIRKPESACTNYYALVGQVGRILDW